MTARSSFLLCVALTSIPLGVGVFGLYELVTLRGPGSGEPSAIQNLCLIAFRRTVDTAGHVTIYAALGLLACLLMSAAVSITRGWRETRRIRNLGNATPPSSSWETVEDFRRRHLPRHEIRLFDADAPLAVTVGYLSPRILLSAGLLEVLDQAELTAVLHHEAAHVARRDPLRTFIMDACRTALPFVPVIPLAASQFEMKKEVEADAAAIAAMGGASPLASALAKVIDGMPGEAAHAVGLTPTQARIDALLGKPATCRSRWDLALLLVLSLPAAALLSAGFYLMAHAPHISTLHICPK